MRPVELACGVGAAGFTPLPRHVWARSGLVAVLRIGEGKRKRRAPWSRLCFPLRPSSVSSGAVAWLLLYSSSSSFSSVSFLALCLLVLLGASPFLVLSRLHSARFSFCSWSPFLFARWRSVGRASCRLARGRFARLPCLSHAGLALAVITLPGVPESTLADSFAVHS